MITNESAIHCDSVNAHTLLHIHLQRMIALSQLEPARAERHIQPSKRRALFNKLEGRRTGWVLLTLLLLLEFGLTRA